MYWENEETKNKSLYDVETYLENYNEFHIYKLIWTEDKIIMNIDDEETFNLALNDELKSKAFQNEFYLDISLAVGKDIISKSDSPNSFEMVIDYITIKILMNFQILNI